MSNLEALSRLSPFNNWLNLKLETLESGFCRIALPWSDSLIGDPRVPRIHGGVLASLMDATGGAACMSLMSKHDSISTIDLQINYLEQGLVGDFYCDSRAVRVGKRIGTARMDVYSLTEPANPKLVAIGTGVYNLVRKS